MLVRDDYILRPSDCYDYKVMTRVNQQVNKIFNDLEELEAKPKSCESCKWFEDGKDREDWCTNIEFNNQIDPDGLLDCWFTPEKGFYCSKHEESEG